MDDCPRCSLARMFAESGTPLLRRGLSPLVNCPCGMDAGEQPSSRVDLPGARFSPQMGVDPRPDGPSAVDVRQRFLHRERVLTIERIFQGRVPPWSCLPIKCGGRVTGRGPYLS